MFDSTPGGSLQEALKKVTNKSVEAGDSSVTLCLRSQKIFLAGLWKWNINSPAIYCSDVMYFPKDVEATKAIIHPDDLPKIISSIPLMVEGALPRLEFRIITTFGEVIKIVGEGVSISAANTTEVLPRDCWLEALEKIVKQREVDFLHLQNELAEYSDRLHGVGSWTFNKTTAQSWYSDNMFRIHKLAPQSLNAHIGTFVPFIYKDDKHAVINAFEKAYDAEFPLIIEYRIQLAGDDIRYVQQVTKWMYNYKGETILCGIVRDVTEERKLADLVLAAQSKNLFHRKVLNLFQQQSAAGYWYVNLVTKKASYSENYYRIHGFKQFDLPVINSFLHLVHADDRKKVEEAFQNMYAEKLMPEIDFRIIRPDGKLRYLRQSAAPFTSVDKEEWMIGVVQDITVQRGLEKKVEELSETASLNQLINQLTEEASEVSTITWLKDGIMQWSNSFYQLTGVKPGAEVSQKLLYRHIHPDDLKRFQKSEAAALAGESVEEIDIKLISKNATRNLRISLRPLSHANTVVGIVRDVTKQTSLLQQQQHDAAVAKTLEDAAHDIIIFTNNDNTILHWNAHAADKTRIAKEDALYRNLFEVLPSLHNEAFHLQLNNTLNGEGVANLRAENLYLKKAHDYSLIPLQNEDKVITGVLHVVQDVSKQIEMQQQLSHRLAFIESLLGASVDQVIVLDRFMNYLYWNKRTEDYFGIAKEKIIGKNILEVFPSFRNHPSYSEFRKVLRGETVYLPPYSNEEMQEHSETYLSPIKDEAGEVTAVLWIVHDLTESKKAQKEILQPKGAITQNESGKILSLDDLNWRSQFLEMILDNSFNRITVFDANCRFMVWNKRCEEIHGLTKDKVIGKTIFEVFPGIENYPVYMNAQERSLNGEKVHIPFVDDGFTGAYLELFYVPLKNEAGKTYAVLNIMHDVTTFVKNSQSLDFLNKQLEARYAELEQKNEEITDFAFIASHDMKEPLRKIHTFADWLMETEKEWLSQQGKTVLGKMNASVKRMELLIDDILVLTKIHSDRDRKEEVDLDKILSQVKDEMADWIAQTNTVIEAKKLPVIKGNANQVFHLFKNLLSNAIKFQKHGSVPKILITSEIVNGSEVNLIEPREEYLRLSFIDNGFGFDQTYAKKIFQVFQRLHDKQEFEGTGIGLAICKKIMENHEGLINVESELGKGSVFNCFFPLH